MVEDKKEDNTSQDADNTAPEEKAPNLPVDKPTEEVKAPEPQDPELAEWSSQDNEMTYKRYKDSSAEAERLKDVAATTQKEWDNYQQQVAQELQAVYQKDPEVAAKLFGIEVPKEADATEQPTVDPKQIAHEAAIEARAQLEVESFHQRNESQFKDEDDWQDTQALALSFVGKKDGEGNPFTIQTALRDATLLRHPELIGDKAISDHLTSQANRASASDSGDTPAGTSPDDKELGPKYDELAEEMGIELTSEMKENILQRQRDQEAP